MGNVGTVPSTEELKTAEGEFRSILDNWAEISDDAEPAQRDSLLQSYLNLKSEGGYSSADEVIKALELVDQAHVIESLEREHSLLKISAASVPVSARVAIARHIQEHGIEEELPSSLEIPTKGDSLAMTAVVNLGYIKSLQEQEEESPSLIASARTYLAAAGKDTTQFETNEQILEAVKIHLRNRIITEISTGDTGGHLSLRGPERVTGVVGTGETGQQGLQTATERMTRLLCEINQEIDQIFGIEVPQDKRKDNLIITLSEEPQRASLEIISQDTHSRVDATIDYFGRELVLTNNVAIMSRDKLPGQLVVISKRTPGEGETTLRIEKKGTQVTARGIDPADGVGESARVQTIQHNLAEELGSYDVATLRLLESISVDQFLPSEAVHRFLRAQENSIYIDQLLKENGGFSVELVETVYSRILLEATEGAAITKPDISGFSKLTVFLEELGVSPKEITYPYFHKLIKLAENLGALIDRFAGDSGDAAFLSEESLRRFGMADSVDSQFSQMTADERARLFSIGSKVLFEMMVSELSNLDSILEVGRPNETETPAVADTAIVHTLTMGEDLFGFRLNEISEDNYDEVAESVRNMYRLTLEEQTLSQTPEHAATLAVVNELIVAYSLRLFTVRHGHLGIKAISQHENKAHLNLYRVGTQVIQEIGVQQFAQAESALEAQAKNSETGIVICGQEGVRQISQNEFVEESVELLETYFTANASFYGRHVHPEFVSGETFNSNE